MAPFVPNGFLTVNQAIDRIAEQKCDPPLSDKEKTGLQEYRAWWYALTHPKPLPVRPVRKANDRSKFTRSDPTTSPTPAKQQRPLPNFTSPEEIRGLQERERQLNNLRAVSTQELQQLIYSGQVPWVTITDSGEQFETPAHVCGGHQWKQAIRGGMIKWLPRGDFFTVSGWPLIPEKALEDAYNPDNCSKEEPGQKRARGRRARAQEAAHLAFAALYPNGLPKDPWKTITGQVNDWLEDNGMLPISEESVRRAAKRK